MTSRAEDDKPTWMVWLDYFKILYSLALTTFCVVCLMAAEATNQTTSFEDGVPAAAAIVITWVLFIWLGMIEGGQGCLVGLQPVDKEKYRESHPITYRCCVLAHKGDNMERFIVGRQFLVVLIIFVVNMMGSAIKGATIFGWASTTGVIEVFLSNSLALILSTIVLGQLTAQVNAAVCMLDFINVWFMYFNTHLSLAIEWTGLLHSVYLVQWIIAVIKGEKFESKEENPTGLKTAWFWIRCFYSLGFLGFCLAITLELILKGWTQMWDGVSPAVSIVIFFLLLVIVGILEGQQIAAFAVLKVPESEYKDNYKIAYTNCRLMFKGKNLAKFLIGRQILVATLMFVVARIASPNPDKMAGATVFNTSGGFQKFVDTGLLGAVVLTIIGSLIWRLLAAAKPLVFMSNPVITVLIYICLFLNEIGICAASWGIAWVLKLIFRYKEDWEYIGRPEEEEAGDLEKGEEVDDLELKEKERNQVQEGEDSSQS